MRKVNTTDKPQLLALYWYTGTASEANACNTQKNLKWVRVICLRYINKLEVG